MLRLVIRMLIEYSHFYSMIIHYKYLYISIKFFFIFFIGLSTYKNGQSPYQNNIPRQAENANFVNSVNLDLHKSVIDVDAVHQASNEVNQTASPQGSQDTTQRVQSTIQPNLPDYEVFPTEIKNKTWGNMSHESFCNTINGVYDEIVHFRRNIFNVPLGRAGKAFIEELTFWIKQFNSNSDLNCVALKAFIVLPTLILQKPSATSKSKKHCAAIVRRLNLWRQGDLDLLLKEVRFIQGKFVNSKKTRTVEDISKVFAKLVSKESYLQLLSFWIARAQRAYSTLHQES